jgi:hypothetical protein
MCRTAILPPSPQLVDALWSVYTSSVTTARRVHYSYDEYLGALEQSGVKLEFCDGEIYAMAGGTPAHAELAASVIRLLGNALRGSCKVYSSDLKVRIEATDLSTLLGPLPTRHPLLHSAHVVDVARVVAVGRDAQSTRRKWLDAAMWRLPIKTALRLAAVKLRVGDALIESRERRLPTGCRQRRPATSGAPLCDSH